MCTGYNVTLNFPLTFWCDAFVDVLYLVMGAVFAWGKTVISVARCKDIPQG